MLGPRTRWWPSVYRFIAMKEITGRPRLRAGYSAGFFRPVWRNERGRAGKKTGAERPFSVTRYCPRSVAVMLRLVRAVHRHAQVRGLIVGQLGQLHADLLQMQARDFLVELLRQDVDLGLVGVLVRPQVDLRQGLVG